MARIAVDVPEGHSELDYDGVKRRQGLFGYSYSQAAQMIQGTQAQPSQARVSDSRWDMTLNEPVSSRTVAQGISATANASSTYLLKLGGPLDEAEKAKRAAGLAGVPAAFRGADDADEAAVLGKVDATAKSNILGYLAPIDSRFQSTFVRHSTAKKDLSSFLGTQYSVWYFFYATLVDPGVLGHLLGCDDPSYRPVTVGGGVLRTRNGKYKALGDAEADKNTI
ncbi:hypothetical protein DL769_003659 [Monosporascus sp. CRB-8-3]|nr:hypothetical protein DL769_003659 [Monosporascus sp. CRB-8-3]